MTLVRGDDTQAFGGDLLTISLTTELVGYTITKAIFRCGSIEKEYANPVFPLTVNLTSVETKELTDKDSCYLLLYDENNLRRTCEGTLILKTESQKVD